MVADVMVTLLIVLVMSGMPPGDVEIYPVTEVTTEPPTLLRFTIMLTLAALLGI